MGRIAYARNETVGGLAFLILFPLFFVYHTGIAQEWWPPALGGLFGYTIAAFLPFLVWRLFIACHYLPTIVTDVRFGLFVALLAWASSWLAFNFMLDQVNPAHGELGNALLTWVGMFALGIVLPLWSGKVKWFVGFMWGIVGILSLATIDASALMSTATVEGAATYQGLSRSMMVTGAFLVATTPRTPIRVLIGLGTMVSLFFIGARSELFGFIAAYALTEFLINRRSAGGQLLLAAVTILTVGVVAANLDLLGASRQLQVLHLDEAGSWIMRNYLTGIALTQIAESPIMGQYGGHWQVGEGLYSHNALSVWVSLGLIGFLLYMALCLSATWASVRTLIEYPTFRTAQMATLMNVSTLLLVILSKPIFWEMPPMAWGLALAAVVQVRESGWRRRPAQPVWQQPQAQAVQ